MTLVQAVERLRSRVRVDLESEVDLDDNVVATTALMSGAQLCSREAYLFWELQSTLTLTASEPEYNLLSACAHRIFEPRSVHINGNWLDHKMYPDFVRAIGDYQSESSNSTPGMWTMVDPDTIRISQPPNATAVAASDNFVAGFREHALYTWTDNQATELQGAGIHHQLYVDRAALDITVSYTRSPEGIAARKEIERHYSLKVYGGYDANGQYVQGLKYANLDRV